MRAYVFTDASLKKQAGRFVWLSIDTEKEKNAAFLAKYPVEVWPTLMVIDPAREQAVLRWPGSLDAKELVKLLDDGERAVAGGGDAGAVELARADRLAAEGKKADAARAYRAALPKLPADKRPRAIESMLVALTMANDPALCASQAVALVPSMPRGPAFANAASYGLGCAAQLGGEAGARAKQVLLPLTEEAVTLPGLLADDRSSFYEQLVELRAQAGDEAGAKALAQKWLAFLDAEAARAPTPAQRAAFDPHRVSAAIALGEPLRVVPALEASERDLPKDYNAPARLAIVYRAAHRYDDALAAIDRALGRVYGPRAIRLYETKADIQVDKGDPAGARATLSQALTAARALPVEQRRAQLVARLEAKLQKL